MMIAMLSSKGWVGAMTAFAFQADLLLLVKVGMADAAGLYSLKAYVKGRGQHSCHVVEILLFDNAKHSHCSADSLSAYLVPIMHNLTDMQHDRL